MNRFSKAAQYVLISGVLFAGFAVPIVADAENLPVARVFYREDGGVSIMYFVAEACEEGETMKSCMDRTTEKSPELKGRPYDDVLIDELPKDRSKRDQWRGEKGRGIWVDESLRTKSGELDRLNNELEAELDKDQIDSARVLKLQRLIDQVKDISGTVLTEDEVAMLDEKEQGFFGRAMRAVGNFFASVGGAIRDTALALTSLVTDTLSVGSPAAPAGITIYDQQTGEPFCVVVKDGQLQNIPGECTPTSAEPSQPAEDPGGGNGNGNGGGNGQGSGGTAPEPAPEEPVIPGVEVSEPEVVIETPTTPEPEPAPSPEPASEPIQEPTPTE